MHSLRSLGLVALTFLACVAIGEPLSAQSVFLRGYEVTPEHIVFASIDDVRGESAVINLGFAHGMRLGTTLVAIRRVQDQIIPICGLFVTLVDADHSRCEVEGPFRVQKGDIVLMHASWLDLWGSNSRFDHLAEKRVAQRQSANRYSTLDASPALIEEAARDDAFRSRKNIPGAQVGFVAESLRRTSPYKQRLGALTTPPAIPETPADGEEATEETKAAPPVSDDAVILGEFLTAAESHDQLLARLSTSRLQQLRLLDAGDEVTIDNAPLYREILIAWTKKALGRKP